jgi:putative inorganic carbon (hco3(-)) transporter
MSITGQKTKLVFILIFCFILASLLPFIDFSPSILFFLFLLIGVFTTAFINPKLGLYGIILVRPVLDVFTGESIASAGRLSLNPAGLFGILSILFALYVGLVRKDKLRSIPLLFAWAGFLLISLFSVFYTDSLSTTLTEWLRLSSIASLFLLGYVLMDKGQDLVNLVRVSIASALAPSILAVYQFITQTGMTVPLEGIYNRIYGSFAHPNLFAYYLLVPIALSLLIFLAGDKRKVRVSFFILPAIFFSMVLVMTYTRGAWIALLLLIFFIGAFRFRILLVTTALAALLLYAVLPPVQVRINDMLRPDPYGSIEWRKNLWRDSMVFAKERPVTGYGTGVAKDLILQKRGPEFGSSDPHNDYLKIFIENGLLGLAAYAILVASMLGRLLFIYLRSRTTTFRALVLAMAAASVSIFIMSYADNILRNTALQWTYWALIGGLLRRGAGGSTADAQQIAHNLPRNA